MSESLEFVTTDELVDEMFRRHDYGVVCAGRPAKDGSHNEWLLRWSGPVHACIGAATHIAASLTKVMSDATENVNEVAGDEEDAE